MTGSATLYAGLITRQTAQCRSPSAPSPALLRALEADGYGDKPEHRRHSAEGRLAPSAGLSADLISAGRLAYRAERQRQARERHGQSSQGTPFGRGQRQGRGAEQPAVAAQMLSVAPVATADAGLATVGSTRQKGVVRFAAPRADTMLVDADGEAPYSSAVNSKTAIFRMTSLPVIQVLMIMYRRAERGLRRGRRT